jgi:hypothetical protein
VRREYVGHRNGPRISGCMGGIKPEAEGTETGDTTPTLLDLRIVVRSRVVECLLARLEFRDRAAFWPGLQ